MNQGIQRLAALWAATVMLWISVPAAQSVTVQANPIDNFGEVTPKLWRGALPSEAALQYLAKHNFKTIVDLRVRYSYKEEEQARRLGMTYVSLPFIIVMFPSKAEIHKFQEIADDPKTGKVFVHCLAGGDRTSVMIAIYRMQRQHWSYEKAHTEMVKYRFLPWLLTLLQTVQEASPDYHESPKGPLTHSVKEPLTHSVAHSQL
jgi:protein tyrosine phosphatase (PTP) superfamily phosphohydrolase (DUF442 family)